MTTLVACLSLFTVCSIFSWFQPRVLGVSYDLPGKEKVQASLPLRMTTVGEDVRVSVVLSVPLHLIPTAYDVIVDDCLQEVLVDGVSTLQYPDGLCDSSRRHRVPLSLTPGIHQLTFVTRDNGWVYHFDFAVPRTDSLSLARWLILGVILLTYLWSLRFVFQWSSPAVFALGATFASVVLRYLYASVTPFFIRSHEWDRHVEYLRYVRDSFHIPPASGGWEFFQPPLYYFFGAVWWRVAEYLQGPASQILVHVQTLSFLLSIVSACFLAGIAWVCVKNRRDAPLAILLMSIVPGIVYFTSQISNDALVAPLGFCLIFFSLLFVRRPTLWLWYSIVGVFSCIALTKLNAFALAPFVFMCTIPYFIRFRPSLKHGVFGLILFVSLFAWYPFVRLVLEEDVTRTVTVGSVGMNPATSVGNSMQELLTFNPVRVLSTLYVDPMKEGKEKGYFIEYFFQSIFFGEYQFPASYRFLDFTMLLVAIIVCCFSFVGLIIDLRRPSLLSLPMIVLFDALVLAAITIRILIPFSPLQDFRYSIFLVVPLAYYFFRCVDSLNPSLRRFALSCAWALVSVEAIFFLKLAFDVAI